MASAEIRAVVDAVLTGFGEAIYKDFHRPPTALFLADVEYEIEKLKAEVFVWNQHLRNEYPCIADMDGLIPVSIRVGWPRFYLWNALWGDAPEQLRKYYQARQVELVFSPMSNVLENVRKRLTKFLSVRSNEDEAPEPMRARAVGAAPSGFTQPPNPYLPFEVHTRESGLRVHYSPAYFLDWSHVFGTPTTPSNGWIMPGRYKFGGMRMNGDFLVDNSANFDIPPLSEAHLVLK